MAPTSRFPSLADVQAIVAQDRDATLRNLQITEGYHSLSSALFERTGSLGMNWCTLGTWASKTAGTFIRGDEIPHAFRKTLLSGGPFAEVVANDHNRHLDLVAIATGIAGDITVYITEGNRVVFQELGGTISRFLQTLGDDAQYSQSRLDVFLTDFQPDLPKPDMVEVDSSGAIHSRAQGGQQLLAEMTTAYYQAMFETDPKKRAELLLLGNACGGLHEQTRLQTYIERSLQRPVYDLFMARAHNLANKQQEPSQWHHRVDTSLPPLAQHLSHIWEDFSTAALMTLTLPDSVLHLSRPIRVQSGQRFFPNVLQKIENRALSSLLERFAALRPNISASNVDHFVNLATSIFSSSHATDHGGLDVGATNWTELKQRMTYILTLFRSRADDPNLVLEPFSAEQRILLAANQIPEGRL